MKRVPPSIGALLIVAFSPALHAEMSDMVSASRLEALRARGQLSRTASESGDLRYLPALGCAEEIRAGVASPNPSVVVEFLALARTPGRRLGEAPDWLAVHNSLRSVSRLQGLEYYSASRHEQRVLYTTSYRVSSPSSRERQADPLVVWPPQRQEIWVYQEDTTFGGNIYAVTYEGTDEYLLMKIANHTTMRTMLLPMVRPGGMVLYLLVVADGEELLFYATAAARLLGPFARAGIVEESFSNRVKAMYQWFRGMMAIP